MATANALTAVADRNRHVEALRRSEERFALLARATGEAIWDNDFTTGIQEWDGATEALFGYPPHSDGTGEWWEERIHPDDRERVLTGLAAALHGGGESWEEEYRFRRADGSHVHVLDRARVVRDGHGEPVRMVGAMADVTQRKLHEEELRRSEELFRTTFEAAAAGMAHISPDGTWLRVNDALCEIVGYPRQELVRMSCRDLTLPEDLAACEERTGRLLAGKAGHYSAEGRCVRKDGSRVWVSLSVSLMRKPSGAPDFVVCVANDATERKLRELVPDPLTPRELAVLRRIAAKRTNQQVAEDLRYSLGTVKLSVQNIIAKLGVEDRKQAAARSLDIGLVAPPRSGEPRHATS